MRKLKAAPFEKIHNAVAASTFHEVVRIWLANVLDHTDIARKNQNISTVGVLNVEVSKFKMNVGRYCNFH
jgi:hypothetical protein